MKGQRTGASNNVLKGTLFIDKNMRPFYTRINHPKILDVLSAMVFWDGWY
jgi:hypothetical protein